MASRRSPVIGDTSTPAANGPDPFSASCAQHDVAAHGMAERQDRPGGGGRHDLVQEQPEVGHVGGEIVDMALVAVGQRPVGQALAAPIHGDHGIAAAQQLAHDLGRVLFDELAPAGQDDDGAARSSRDVPAGIAQTRAGALEKAVAVGRHVGRSQIGRHGRPAPLSDPDQSSRAAFWRRRRPDASGDLGILAIIAGGPFTVSGGTAIDRSVAASSAKGRRRGNRAQGSLEEVSRTAWLSARRLSRSGTVLASTFIVRRRHATAIPTLACATGGSSERSPFHDPPELGPFASRRDHDSGLASARRSDRRGQRRRPVARRHLCAVGQGPGPDRGQGERRVELPAHRLHRRAAARGQAAQGADRARLRHARRQGQLRPYLPRRRRRRRHAGDRRARTA